MAQTAVLLPDSSPRWGEGSFGYSSGFRVGNTTDGGVYCGRIPFAPLDPNWNILSLKLRLQRTDTLGARTHRYGVNQSTVWGDRNTLDWSLVKQIPSGVGTKEIDLTAGISVIKAYTGTWQLQVAHGAATYSYMEFTGGTGTNAPQLVVEYETASIETTNLTCGQQSTIAVTTPAMSGNYLLRYSFENESGDVGAPLANATTQLSWTPPLSFVGLITVSDHAPITFTLTRDGVEVYEKDIPLYVPADIVPTIVSVQFTPDNPPDDTIGTYVQGRSKARCSIATQSAYGAEVYLHDLSIGGFNLGTVDQIDLTTGILNNPGALDAVVTIKDMRGRTATQTIPAAVTVYPYTAPIILDMGLARALDNTTEANDGTYLKLTLQCKFSAINNLNTRKATVVWGPKDGTMSSPITLTLPSTGDRFNFTLTTLLGGEIGPGAYTVRATLEDRYNAITEEDTLASNKIWLDLNADGEGITFGGTSSEGGKDIFKLPVRFDGSIDFAASTLEALVSTLVGAGVWNSAHLKIQTGLFTSASGGVTITFPTAFPSTPMGAFVVPFTSNPAYWSNSALGASSVKLHLSSSGVNCRWIAIWMG